MPNHHRHAGPADRTLPLGRTPPRESLEVVEHRGSSAWQAEVNKNHTQIGEDSMLPGIMY